MKKIFLFAVAALMLSSCAITKSSVKNLSVSTPVLTTTVADIEVREKPITYVYNTTGSDKTLSFNEVLQNAQYQALKDNGYGDVLVQVTYKVEGKRGIYGVRKVKRITITGYPAVYKNFRTPTVEDRANVESFYNEDSVINIRRK